MLNKPLGDILDAVRAKRPQRLPVLLARDEVRSLFHHLDGPHWLPGCLLYGSGLRLMECLRLRVKDLDFEHLAITVHAGTVGTQGYSYHTDLYPCAESGRECRGQSVG